MPRHILRDQTLDVGVDRESRDIERRGSNSQHDTGNDHRPSVAGAEIDNPDHRSVQYHGRQLFDLPRGANPNAIGARWLLFQSCDDSDRWAKPTPPLWCEYTHGLP